MPRKQYLVFDLDQTLVDTSNIAYDRNIGNWTKVKAGIPDIRAFQGILNLLASLKRTHGCKIAVYTSSPRWYCDQVLAQIGLSVDSSVCFGEVSKEKPSPDGVLLIMALLTGFSGDRRDSVAVKYFLKNTDTYEKTIVVGDSWKDVLAAHWAKVESIGALWGTQRMLQRELVLAQPTFIAETVSHVEAQLTQLAQSESLLSERQRTEDQYRETLWERVENGMSENIRGKLRVGQLYYFARYRYSGNYQVSHGNQLVANLKISTSDRGFFKKMAAKRFADDLSILLPDNSQIAFIVSSKVPTDPNYDNRFELVQGFLNTERPDVTVSWPISQRISATAAHSSSDSDLRDPSLIMQGLVWKGYSIASESIYIVDDVITSGGHFEAYIRMFEQYAPSIRVIGAFWALHVS